MFLSNYDWSENGVIATARQIQSEYWCLKYYSLFISITTYLIFEAWLDRSSKLSKGTEVTVEPEGLSQPGSLEPAKGSFFATIHSGGGVEGEDTIYVVQKPDMTTIGGVERSRLRHRKARTTAFVQVTDEKRHDACTTQHFLNKQFEEWRSKIDLTKFWACDGSATPTMLRILNRVRCSTIGRAR